MARSELHGSREYRHVIDRLRFAINLFDWGAIFVGCMSILVGLVLGVLTLIFHQIAAWDVAVVLMSGGVIALLWAVYSDSTTSRTTWFIVVTLLNGYNPTIQHGIYLDAEDRNVLEAKVIRKAYPHVNQPFWWFTPLWLRMVVVASALNLLATIILRGNGVWPFDIITKREMIVMAVMSAQALFVAFAYESVGEFSWKNMTLLVVGGLVVMGVLSAIGIYAHYAILDLYLPFFVDQLIQNLVELAVWLVCVVIAWWLLFEEKDAEASKEVS